MKKFLTFLAGVSLLAACGGGVDTGTTVDLPPLPGDIPIPDIPSNVRLTSFDVQPLGGVVGIGDTITISASWTIEGIVPQKTKVKLYIASPPYFLPDQYAGQVFFNCDDGGACQGSFVVQCVRVPDIDLYVGLECTLPDGSIDYTSVRMGSLPNTSCVLLYLETTDTDGRVHHEYYSQKDMCFSFTPS